MKKIKDVMVDEVVTIAPSASVAQAAEIMKHANVGMLPIVVNGRLRAIVTDRDLVVRALAQGADPHTTRAIECATLSPRCARPDWEVADALAAMAQRRVGRLPVVDDDERVIGVVSLGSLVLRGPDERAAVAAGKRVSARSAKRPSAKSEAPKRRRRAA